MAVATQNEVHIVSIDQEQRLSLQASYKITGATLWTEFSPFDAAILLALTDQGGRRLCERSHCCTTSGHVGTINWATKTSQAVITDIRVTAVQWHHRKVCT